MIRVEHLSKTYHQKSETTHVFEDLNFSLPDNGLVSIVGKSGSGKTSLLRTLSSFDNDYSGNIYINNRELRTLNANSLRQQTFGFLYQEASLLRNYTVEENILFPFRLFGIPYDQGRFDELVTALGIQPLLKRKTRLLSVGQRQRVALCRTLLKNCPILYADEPTSSLDGKLADEVFRFLVEYGKNHLVVVVTHDRERAERYSDVLYELEDGALTKHNPSSDALPNSVHVNVPEAVRRIPFRSVVKNASLLTNKALFTVFSLLTLFVLIPMTLSFSLGNYDQDTVMLNSYYGTNTMLSINRSLGSSPEYGNDNVPQAFDYVESKAIEENLVDYAYMASSARFEVFFPLTTNPEGSYVLPQDSSWRAFSIDATTTDSFGFSLVAGRLPAEGENELAITRLQYEEFSSYGIQYYDSYDENMHLGDPIDINGYSDILNTSVLFKNQDKSLILKIVGIIETNPDSRVYDFFNGQDIPKFQNLLDDTVTYTYHNAIYLPSSLMNDFHYSNSPDEFYLQTDFSEAESASEETNPERMTVRVQDESNLPVDIDYFELDKTEIEEGEIAISQQAFKYPVVRSGVTELVSYNDYFENLVNEYATNNLPNDFVNPYPDMSDIDAYAYEILSSSENSYAPEYNRAYFENLAITGARSYVESHYANNIVYITQTYSVNYIDYYTITVPLRLVGTFYEDYYAGSAAVSQADFDVFYSYYYVDLMTIDSFVIKLTGNRSKDLNLIHYLQNQHYYIEGQPAHIQFHDPVMVDLTKFNGRFESLRQPFSNITYIGISLLVLLLILQSVISNKSLTRLYKLLRDFGASRLSMIFSYSLVSIISFAMSLVFGLGVSYLVITVINQAIVESGGIILLLTISGNEIGFIIGISSAVSALMFLTNFILIQFDSFKNRIRRKS